MGKERRTRITVENELNQRQRKSKEKDKSVESDNLMRQYSYSLN